MIGGTPPVGGLGWGRFLVEASVNVRLLIDGIVRQTTVLLAQLSTAAGVRAPLAHVADQIFLDLSREIEAQGVGRKVVADMFGMALRAYQKKVQRLEESATDRNRTLWQAVLEFLSEGSRTREQILRRFQHDGEREVGAVLNDLVTSGLAYVTGKGEAARYGVSTEADYLAIAAADDVRAIANVAWLRVFLGAERTEAALVEHFGIDQRPVREAVESLVQEGRLRRNADGTLSAENVVIPVGATDGWEAAVLDHYRAVATAIASKAQGGARSTPADQIGGTTLSFAVYPGHPYEDEVRGLLRAVRLTVNELWNKASSYNNENPPPENAAKVLFYFGQLVTEPEERAE
ncbi:MAG TPA: hypothetical protein VHE30_06560 [Polyangiaceae bacterium]|nr:hypothetical protein [Polyangiaceae bacterium]